MTVTADESGQSTPRVPLEQVAAYAVTVALILGFTTYYGWTELKTDSTMMVGGAFFVLGFDPYKTWAAGIARVLGLVAGVALGDFDGDGDDDVYRGGSDNPNLLLRNEGSGVFFDATSPPLDDSGRASFTAWADIDNDGDLDLFLANGLIGADKLFRNDGGGSFADITGPLIGATSITRGAAWADYDLDGYVDLYLARSGTAAKLLRNQGGAGFTDATPSAFDGVSGQAGAWGDMDGDGDPDLCVVTYGDNRLFRNDGGGNFVNIATNPVNSSAGSEGVAWGDVDNDGDLDLYIVNFNSTIRRPTIRREPGSVCS